MKFKQPHYQANANHAQIGGRSLNLTARDIINNGNIAVNNDLGIHAERLLNWGTIAAKGTIDRNTLLNEGLERITAAARDTPIDTTLAEPLEKIFDLKQIQTGFDIATTLGANMSEFISIKAKDRDAVGQNPVASVNGEPLYERDKDSPDGYKHDAQGNRIPISTVAQAYANGYQAWELNETSGAQLTEFTSMTRTWGNGGWGTIVLTSLAGAVSGNVTGGAAQLIQNSAINVIQQYAAQGNKAIADAVNNPALSEVVRGLLHAITSCVATDTKGGSCAEGATAAASTVALNKLFHVDVKNMTETEKLAYSNLIQSIVAGVAFGAGGNAANAQFNARAEVGNNGLLEELVDEVLRAMDAFPGGGGVKYGTRRIWAFIFKRTAGLGRTQTLQLTKQMLSDDGVVRALLRDSTSIAGNGTNVVLRDAPRLVYQYGGEVSDWAKITTTSHILSDGTRMSVHAYQNIKTGLVVEPKSIIDVVSPISGIPW